MGTKIDSRFMYLRFEYGLTEAQMNSLVNEVIASNELLLANSSNRDDLLYDLVVNRLTGTTREAAAAKEVDKNYIEYPLPAHNKVLRDGKFKINTFTSIMTDSNKNIEGIDNMEF